MNTSLLPTQTIDDDPVRQAQVYTAEVLSQETAHFEVGQEWIEFVTDRLMSALSTPQQDQLRQAITGTFLADDDAERLASQTQMEQVLRLAFLVDQAIAPGWSPTGVPVSSDQGHAVL